MYCEIEVNCGEAVLTLVVDVKSFEVMTCSSVVVVSVVVCTTPSVVVDFNLGVNDLLVEGNCEFVSFPSVVDGDTEGNVEAEVEEDVTWPSSPDDSNAIPGSGWVD